jgi:hypothetical protein
MERRLTNLINLLPAEGSSSMGIQSPVPADCPLLVGKIYGTGMDKIT